MSAGMRGRPSLGDRKTLTGRIPVELVDEFHHGRIISGLSINDALIEAIDDWTRARWLPATDHPPAGQTVLLYNAAWCEDDDDPSWAYEFGCWKEVNRSWWVYDRESASDPTHWMYLPVEPAKE